MSNPSTGFSRVKHSFFEPSFVSIPANRITSTNITSGLSRNFYLNDASQINSKNFIEEKERIEIDMLTKNRKFINAIMELEIGEL